jgi:hypothetical protein
MECAVLGLYTFSGVGSGVRRQGLALSIGSNWEDLTWRLRQNPVSETLCGLNKYMKMDNGQKHNNCINVPSSQSLDLP